MHVGRALRHAEKIEQCLADAGAEQMLLGGPMPPVMQIGRLKGHFFADRVYVIATNGRVEKIEGSDYEQMLTELLPEDADVVLAISYPIFSGADATLYTVPRSTPTPDTDRGKLS